MAAEKPTPPFDTFVFDVDGTLLDTLDDLVVLTNDALAEFNLPPRTREEVNSYVGNGVKALMYQAVPEGTPQDVADACLARWKENYGTYPNDLTKPYPGIPALLAELRRRGCQLGVLSNKFDGGVQFIMNKCLPDAVDVQHGEGGPQNFPRKPDPTGLLTTIEARRRARCTSATLRATSTWPAMPAAMRLVWTGATMTRPISPPKAGNPTCS